MSVTKRPQDDLVNNLYMVHRFLTDALWDPVELQQIIKALHLP